MPCLEVEGSYNLKFECAFPGRNVYWVTTRMVFRFARGKWQFVAAIFVAPALAFGYYAGDPQIPSLISGRETRPDIKLGICGEHAGDPDSIDFCEKVGLDYVSCSPFRLPVARLAAAQAALRRKQAKP